MFLTTKHSIMNKVISHIHYIYISSLEEKAWIQSVYNKSLFQFITILFNSRQNISDEIIFTFNMFYNQIAFLQH